MKKAFIAVFSMALLLIVGVVGVKAYSNVTQLYNNTNYSISSGGTFNTTKTSTGRLLLANISPNQVYSGTTMFYGYYKSGNSYILRGSRQYGFNASYAEYYICDMLLPGTWKMQNSNGIAWAGVLGFKSATS